MDGNITPLQRLFLAFVAFFAVLLNRRFAEEVWLVRERQRGALPPPGPTPGGEAAPEPSGLPPPAAAEGAQPGAAAPAPPAAPGAAVPPAPLAPPPLPAPVTAAPPAPAPAAAPDHAEALHVLALLQRDGRLLDFCSESLEGFSDSEIGAAARTVHAGCRKVFEEYLQLEPVYREPEGASVTVAPGFDPHTIRVTGNVVGSPPFKGSLRHHGWRAARVSFPPIPPGQVARILAPAEVEL
jgi:hypothetical protein